MELNHSRKYLPWRNYIVLATGFHSEVHPTGKTARTFNMPNLLIHIFCPWNIDMKKGFTCLSYESRNLLFYSITFVWENSFWFLNGSHCHPWSRWHDTFSEGTDITCENRGESVYAGAEHLPFLVIRSQQSTDLDRQIRQNKTLSRGGGCYWKFRGWEDMNRTQFTLSS